MENLEELGFETLNSQIFVRSVTTRTKAPDNIIQLVDLDILYWHTYLYSQICFVHDNRAINLLLIIRQQYQDFQHQ
jgi:hypothetical protein